MREWFEPFSEHRLDALEYTDAGDRVLVPIRARGVGSASGLQVEIDLTIAYQLHDGKITRVDEYDTVEQARSAIKGSG